MKKFFEQVKQTIANQKGMTLLELLVVVVILGILAGISFQAFSGQGEDARVKAHQTNLVTLQNSAERYDLEVGMLDTDLGVLTATHPLITEGYLKAEIENPWDGTNQPFGTYQYAISKDSRGIFYAYLYDAGTSNYVALDADGEAVNVDPAVDTSIVFVAPGAETNPEDRAIN